MVERASRPRLAEEPLAELLLAGDLRGNDLQRDLPPQADVLGAVHHAHPAATDDLFDLVAGDLSPEIAVGLRGRHRLSAPKAAEEADRVRTDGVQGVALLECDYRQPELPIAAPIRA